MDAKTLVVGDVHGCLEELLALLKRAEYREGTDKLVLVGDLIDRGPDSVGVLRFIQEIGAICVRGNHEDNHLGFRNAALEACCSNKREEESAWKSLQRMPHPYVHEALSASDWTFLRSLPLTYWVNKTTVVVHGGLARDSPAKKPSEHACRIRFVDPRSGNSVPGIASVGKPDGAVFWTEAYEESFNVIYGHHTYEVPVRSYNNKGAWTLGIDTGCCYGGSLTGYWVEEDRTVSVESRRPKRYFFT